MASMVPRTRGESAVSNSELRQDQQGGVGVGGAVAAGVGAPGLVEAAPSISSRQRSPSACHRRVRVPTCGGVRRCAVRGPGRARPSAWNARGARCRRAPPRCRRPARAIGRATGSAKPAIVRHVSEYRRWPASHEQPGRVEDPAVAVELVLVGCGVARPGPGRCRHSRASRPAHVRSSGACRAG